jgi:type II secretory pathway component HofQ
MKKWLSLCLIGALSLALPSLRAQDKDHAKPSVPVKVQLVFAEYDGDKKISSMPYVFAVLANERGVDGTSLRVGVRIPIETDGKDQKTTYLDVGSNIDCRVKIEDDGRFALSLTMDRSALYPNKSAEGERLVSEPNGLPLIHQFRTNVNLLLKDGQTAETMLSTDPLNGHTMRVSLTLNVQK